MLRNYLEASSNSNYFLNLLKSVDESFWRRQQILSVYLVQSGFEILQAAYYRCLQYFHFPFCTELYSIRAIYDYVIFE